MKLTRLLLLVPAAGLLMTGCDKKEVPEPTVDSIAVSGVYKTAYAVEEGFEKTGIVVTATYSDGSKKDVSASASFSGFSSAEAGSSTVTVSAEGKSTSFSVEIKAGYEFKDAKALFAKAEIEGVLVPSYFGESVQATEFFGMIYVTTTAEEFAAYKASVAALGWAPEDAGEEEEGYYYFKYGETSYCTLVDAVEDYGMAAIIFEQDYIKFDSFPADRVARYFAKEGIEGVNVPAYQAAGEGAYFELDVSYEGYFNFYANITTSEELVAYKNLLKENGWVVVSPEDPEEEATAEDFKLRYGETYAYVDLIDYTSEEDPEDGTPAYTLVSFYAQFPTPAPATATELMEFIGTQAWGYTEDGDFNAPDEDGIVTSNYTIGYSASSLEVCEDSAECLMAVYVSLAEDLSEFLAPVGAPVYTASAIDLDEDGTPDVGVSEIYFANEDLSLVSYMYAYYNGNGVTVVFQAGPASAYLPA